MNKKNIIILTLSFFTIFFGCGPEEIFKEVGTYRYGNKHGKWVSYCEHGNAIEEGNYKNGNKDGKWTSYFEDGKIWYEGNYLEGKKHGEFIFYGVGNYNKN